MVYSVILLVTDKRLCNFCVEVSCNIVVKKLCTKICHMHITEMYRYHAHSLYYLFHTVLCDINCKKYIICKNTLQCVYSLVLGCVRCEKTMYYCTHSFICFCIV
jgi:hypothetical protein